MSFILATDSACDLPAEMLSAMDIYSRELTYSVDGVEYDDNVTDKVDFCEFYNKMRSGSKTQTSMVNEASAKDFLLELLEHKQDILVIAFDSELSGTYNSFKNVAEELNATSENKIYVVDSLCAAGGEGLLLTLVNEKRQAGATIQEAYEYAENTKQHIMHYFIVDDLKYLARGGRLSKGTAVIANLINIKPVLHMSPEGKLVPFKNVFGRKKSIKTMLDKMSERYNGESNHVYISHGDCINDANALADMVKEKFGLDVTILPLDFVIGSHSGPGTLALFFTGDTRKEK